MLMDEIKVGTDISFPQGFKFRTGGSGTRQECSLGIQKIHLQIGNGKGQSIVFIPHEPGGVNFYETLGNEDVMSGIFTGCVMSTYKVGDKRRVAHVHTGDGDKCCRALMKSKMGGYTSIKNFKPWDDSRDGPWFVNEVGYKNGKFMTFGVVTAQNEQYSIFTKESGKPDRFTVLLVMRQTNQPNEFR